MKGIAFVEFSQEKDLESAMGKNRNFIGEFHVILIQISFSNRGFSLWGLIPFLFSCLD